MPREAPPSTAAEPKVTQLLQQWAAGDEDALRALFPLVLDDLRYLARQHLSREHASPLPPTALVNEVYLRLVRTPLRGFTDRHHFFSLASRITREILVDLGRARNARKRGNGQRPASLDEAIHLQGRPVDFEVVFTVHESLGALHQESPAMAETVELRFFTGLTLREIAEVRGVSLATVERHWAVAKRWLAAALDEQPTVVEASPASAPAQGR